MSKNNVPRNFSWVDEENKIAALAFPDKREDLDFLVSIGIRYLVTLTRELKPKLDEFPELISIDISVDDFNTFTLEQVQQFITVCAKALEERQAGVAVHCRAGIGRTGTLLACYFVHFRDLKPDDAIRHIRALRPNSIETKDQEKTVIDYYNWLHGLKV